MGVGGYVNPQIWGLTGDPQNFFGNGYGVLYKFSKILKILTHYRKSLHGDVKKSVSNHWIWGYRG